MAQIGTLNTFTNSVDEVEALPLQSNYVEIVSKYNSHDAATSGIHGCIGRILSKQEINRIVDKYMPIGCMRYLWDNEIIEIRALLDTGKFKLMDGTACDNLESPFYGYTIPNMDKVYIVGSTSGTMTNTFVGSNTYNLYHNHTNIHNHTIAAHIHSIKHLHRLDGGYVKVTYSVSNKEVYVNKDGSSRTMTKVVYTYKGSSSSSYAGKTTAVSLIGWTSSSTANTSSVAITSLDNTQAFDYKFTQQEDIRPYTLKHRAYVRII